MADLSDLPLRRYRPRQRTVLPAHRVETARFPMVQAPTLTL